MAWIWIARGRIFGTRSKAAVTCTRHFASIAWDTRAGWVCKSCGLRLFQEQSEDLRLERQLAVQLVSDSRHIAVTWRRWGRVRAPVRAGAMQCHATLTSKAS